MGWWQDMTKRILQAVGTKGAESGSVEKFAAQLAQAEVERVERTQRVERLEEEKAALQDDIKDVMAELKGRGYDVKAVRAILKLRKQDPDERQEAEAILELYMNALGMV